MKYYFQDKIHNVGDTVTVNGIKYSGCTDAWFKRHGAIEVVEVEDEGESGLYTISEAGDRLVPFTGQTITHIDKYTDEDGDEQEYKWEETVAHKYFLFVGKKPEPKSYEPTKADKIAEYKQRLAETDYCVIKIAEGVATKEEYSEILTERAELRKMINELEEE